MIKRLLIAIFRFFLNLIYAVLKIFVKQKKQIVYLSRQSRNISEDVQLISAEIQRKAPDCRQIFRFRMLDKGLRAKISYMFGLLGDMYALAGAGIAVCDTYSIAVSCLKHRKNLQIIQIWHAMGAVKKFGWQSVGLEEGRSADVSSAMCMHKNYTCVMAPSEATGRFYEEAFRVPHEKIKIYTLPHMDRIMDHKDKRAQIGKEIPEACGKKWLVYVPTFRENEAEIVECLKEAFKTWHSVGGEDWYLFVSLHPLSELHGSAENAAAEKFGSMELIKAADAVITDYSACTFEAACLKKRLYFYVPDKGHYGKTRGLNIDLAEEMPGTVFTDPAELMKAVGSENYDFDQLETFRKKYVENTDDCTQKMADYMVRLMK